MNNNKWNLIENNSHVCKGFSSEKKLKDYAKDKGYIIKKSYTDSYCFYTIGYQYIPVK